MPRASMLVKYVKAQPWHRGVRYYFRYRNVYQRSPDDPESPEFFARYSALLAGVTIPAQRTGEGTVASVIADYKGTPAFQQLASKTQRDYARFLERFEPVMHLPIEEIKRKHIRELQKPLNQTPNSAKYFAQVCSLLFAHAIDELELIEVNPARR